MGNIRLQYIGRMVKDWPADDNTNPKLWNFFRKGSPYHGSSVSLETLKQWGVIK